MKDMLKVKNLKVRVDDKLVVQNATMDVSRKEIVLLLGPNGSGKTSLLNAIVGHPLYRVVDGSVEFLGEDITRLPIENRVLKGIGIAVQHPPRLRGVKFRKLLWKLVSRWCRSISEIEQNIMAIARDLAIEHLLDREFGVGFSGGELKRSEVALLIAQRPRAALIDEPDSGVDVDSVMIIAEAINKYLVRDDSCIVIVTHTGFIAKHLYADRAYVMIDGSIVWNGSANEALLKIFKEGFAAFMVRGSVDEENR